MANRHLQHIKSSQANKIPTENDLWYGEIAVNYAEGSETLYIKNSNNDIVPFINGNKIEETEETIAQALSDLNERVVENTTAIEENEETTAGALADLDARLDDEASARESLEQAVEDNELVTARALTELRQQIVELELEIQILRDQMA